MYRYSITFTPDSSGFFHPEKFLEIYSRALNKSHTSINDLCTSIQYYPIPSATVYFPRPTITIKFNCSKQELLLMKLVYPDIKTLSFTEMIMTIFE